MSIRGRSFALTSPRRIFWSSGGYVPQWITTSFADRPIISSFSLNPAQTPAGTVRHRFSGGRQDRTSTTLDQYSGPLADGQMITTSAASAAGGVTSLTITMNVSPSWVARRELSVRTAGTTRVYGYAVGAPAETASNMVEDATDSDSSTAWTLPAGTSSPTLTLDLGQAQTLLQIEIVAYQTGTSSGSHTISTGTTTAQLTARSLSTVTRDGQKDRAVQDGSPRASKCRTPSTIRLDHGTPQERQDNSDDYYVYSGLYLLPCIMLTLPACGEPESAPAGGGGSAFLGRSQQPTASSALPGHWFLNRDGERITLNVGLLSGIHSLAGTSTIENAGETNQVVEGLEVDSVGLLQFRVAEPAGTVWYRARVASGVLAGRYARSTGSTPRWPADYNGRVTGWQEDTFNADIVPRVWDIALPTGQRAVLRIDRTSSTSNSYVGTLKAYALDGQLAEQPAEQIDVQAWNGQSLMFVRRTTNPAETYQGTAAGRMISGYAQPQRNGSAMAWSGTRAEVLTHGLGARKAQEVTQWQTLTRERLELLALGGNPQPQSIQVSELGSSVPIIADADDNPFRDDDEAERPQNYTLTEVTFDSRLPGLLGGEDSLARHAHGYVAVPTTPPPPGGYPVALALNGHGGSAYDTFDPAGMYWYGDSFARRGFLVISVDIGHRPLEDRASIYTDSLDGDDPDTGNGTHPAIAPPGLSPDWEEDGERAWDAMRALDYALSRSDVNRKNVTGVGLSMGGEMTDWVAALDTRIAVAVAAGSPSDLAVMSLHGNHPCWTWQRGDVREYYDPGDLNALVASRILVRQSGKQDTIYSNASPPFGTAKEVVWRARPAFQALGGQLIHYLHFDAHAFHVGQFCTAQGAADGVTVPTIQGPSASDPWSSDWSSDGTTADMMPSIFAITPGSAP